MYLCLKPHRFRGLDYRTGQVVPCDDMSRDKITRLIAARLVRLPEEGETAPAQDARIIAEPAERAPSKARARGGS